MLATMFQQVDDVKCHLTALDSQVESGTSLSQLIGDQHMRAVFAELSELRAETLELNARLANAVLMMPVS